MLLFKVLIPIAYCSPARYFFAKVTSDMVYPVLYVALIILLKRMVLGKFTTGPRTNTTRELLRYWFTDKLISNSKELETVLEDVLHGLD